MIKNHIKITLRTLWRHKRITFINVAGLSIGMAATVLIVLWVQNELSFDKNQPGAENIYRIKTKLDISKNETWLWESSPYVLGEFAAKQIPDIVDLTRLKPNTYTAVNLRYNGNIITEKRSAYVDDHWFKVFHYDFIKGSPDAFVKNPFSLILTVSAAKRYFGNHEAVGKVLRIDTVNYQVQAVVKDNPANSSFQYDLLIPIAAELTNPDTRKNALQWGNFNYQTFLKLRQGTNAAIISAKLTSILRKNKKDDQGNTAFSLVNLRDMHFESDLQNSSIIHGNRVIVNVFIVLAVILLITACINYVNLTTARASLRSKEVSIRKITGASHMHLFGQFMFESFVVSLISLTVALLLVQVSMPWFKNFTGKAFAEPFTSPIVWLIISSTLIISFILNGLYPAILLSSFQPLKVFKGKSLLNFKDAGLRRFLVVLQFTVSVVLIIGTMVIYNQLQYVRKIDLGYDKSQVFNFTFPWWKIAGFDVKKASAILNTVKQELKAQSAVAEVSVASSGLVDFNNQSSGSFDWAGRVKSFNPSFAPLQVDIDFQHLMHLKLAEGRWFTPDKADKHNVLLNQTAVQLLHLQKPVIGQRFIHQGDTGTIIGVVKDFHYRSLHEKIGPMIISNDAGSSFYIKTTPGNTQAAISAAKKVYAQFFPNEPFNYDFLDESYNNLYKTEQQSSVLISLFAFLTILISTLGLLGLASFAAEQKIKEIGIRKVLGASVQNIVSLLSVDFLKMVVIASLVAFPVGAWVMNKWLQNFAYRINLSWWIFAASAAIALLIALVTVSFQSVKAAMDNPVNSLRSE